MSPESPDHKEIPALKRILKRRDTIALAFGAMIGWSWVLLTGTWTSNAGTLGAVCAFLLGGVVMVLVALTYAELAAAMPSVGGEHVYSLRALGRRWSFVCSWAILFGYVSVVAFEAVALPFAAAALLPEFAQGHLWTVAGWDVTLSYVVCGIGVAVLLTWINVIGVKPAAFLQQTVTAMIVLVGIIFLSGAAFNGSTGNIEPLFVDDYRGIAAVLIMVPMMFVGFDVIPQAAQEIDLPHAVIGRLVVVSVIAGVAWYVAMIAGVGLSLDAAKRTAGGLTTADAAGAAWGAEWARIMLIVGGIAGIVTSWNAFLIGSSRLVFALAESGMLPAMLARLHPRYGTPYVALMFIGLLSCVSPWFGRPVLVWLINAGSLGIIVAYVLVAISFLVLRLREPEMPRPYRVANGRVVGLLALLSSGAILLLYFPGSAAGLRWPEEWLICGAWVLIGVGLWRLAGREPAEHKH